MIYGNNVRLEKENDNREVRCRLLMKKTTAAAECEVVRFELLAVCKRGGCRDAQKRPRVRPFLFSLSESDGTVGLRSARRF